MKYSWLCTEGYEGFGGSKILPNSLTLKKASESYCEKGGVGRAGAVTAPRVGRWQHVEGITQLERRGDLSLGAKGVGKNESAWARSPDTLPHTSGAALTVRSVHQHSFPTSPPLNTNLSVSHILSDSPQPPSMSVSFITSLYLSLSLISSPCQ